MLSTLAQVVWAVLELTVRNLDGRAIRAIVVGEKGQGDAELSKSLDIKYEARW